MNRLASPSQLRASLLRWSLVCIPGVMLLGFLSGMVGSDPAGPWFQSLVKPELFPPPATFGIVWTVLYLMIGFAFALVCAAWGARGRAFAIVAFIVQFALNLAWSPMFFAAHNIEGALYVIFLLDVAAIVATVVMWRVRRLAGILMLPYLAWILFATVLNYQFLQANPNAGELPERDPGAVQSFEL